MQRIQRNWSFITGASVASGRAGASRHESSRERRDETAAEEGGSAIGMGSSKVLLAYALSGRGEEVNADELRLLSPNGLGAVASDGDRLVRTDARALLHGVSELVRDAARAAGDLLERFIVESFVWRHTLVFVWRHTLVFVWRHTLVFVWRHTL